MRGLLALVLLLAPALRAKPVQPIITELPACSTEVSHEEWSNFLRSNLEADLAPWRTRAPLRANDTLALHLSLLGLRYLPASFKLVLIYNNRLYWPTAEGVRAEPSPASAYVAAFHKHLSALLDGGHLKLPNTVFVYNSDDNRARFGAAFRNWTVPLLSQVKTLGEPDGEDLDIVIPQFHVRPSVSLQYAWHLKQDVAFFRGMPFCSGYWSDRVTSCQGMCPRVYLAWRSFEDHKAGRPKVLDVGLVHSAAATTTPKPGQNNTPPVAAAPCAPEHLPIHPRASLPEHALYKWLLHMEGRTASHKLSQLLLTNSLVLLQQQPFVEYFSRSLRPWTHVVPFWDASNVHGLQVNDVYEAVAELRQLEKEDPAAVQRLIREANLFATRFLTLHARARYLREALLAYNSLFADMEAVVEQYVRQMRKQGFKLP